MAEMKKNYLCIYGQDVPVVIEVQILNEAICI